MSVQIDAAVIRSIIAARRLRDEILGRGVGDAGWIVLLEVYAARLAGQPLHISRLIENMDLPPGNANRWIVALADRGLLVRRDGPRSEPAVLVDLTDEGARRIHAYLTVALRLSPWLS